MSLYRGIGNVEILKKRIPKNKKYQHIKTQLDTGCSLTKYMERIEEIKRNYRYRKDEIFKRLKVSTFAQLVLHTASLEDPIQSENDAESHGPEDMRSLALDTDFDCLSERTNSSPQAEENGGDTRSICNTVRSTLLSVISGVGELNLDRPNQKPASESASSPEPAERPYTDCPYLLLDVRDRDQYNCCHIVSAYSFPIATLSRTMNPYSKEVLQYKNATDKIIIVYDEDERLASQAATIMCQRGIENLFMLSGGLKVMAEKFPEGMITGSVPASCLPTPTSSKGKRCSVQRQPPQAAETRLRFTSDELAKIQARLDETTYGGDGSSRMSSRMSTSSCLSKRSSASSTQRPWK